MIRLPSSVIFDLVLQIQQSVDEPDPDVRTDGPADLPARSPGDGKSCAAMSRPLRALTATPSPTADTGRPAQRLKSAPLSRVQAIDYVERMPFPQHDVAVVGLPGRQTKNCLSRTELDDIF